MAENKDEFDNDPFLDDGFDDIKGTFVRNRNPKKVGWNGYSKKEDRGDNLEGTALTRIQDHLARYEYKDSDPKEKKERLDREKARDLKWVRRVFNHPAELMREADCIEEIADDQDKSLSLRHKYTGFTSETYAGASKEQNRLLALMDVEKKLKGYMDDWHDKILSDQFRTNYGIVKEEKPQPEPELTHSES